MRFSLIFLVSLTGFAMADTSEEFHAAVRDYKANNFQAAEKKFSKINQGIWLPSATNNQAVSQYNQGKVAKSILTWRTHLQTQYECRDAFDNLNRAYAHESAKSIAKLTNAEPPPKVKLILSKSPSEETQKRPKLASVKSDNTESKVDNHSDATEHIETPKKIQTNKQSSGTLSDNVSIENKALLKTLETWRKSWKNANMEEYFNAYVPNHSPKSHTTYAQWQKDRKNKIWAGRIKRLEISKISITLARNLRTASVSFEQLYVSQELNDLIKKRLRMHKHHGYWLIYKEDVVRKVPR